MLTSDTVDAVGDEKPAPDRTLSRTEKLRALRDARSAARRAVYAERKDAGLCTRCGKVHVVDDQLCKRCSRKVTRARNASMRGLYKMRRKKKQCTRCGRKSPDRVECLVCLARRGELPIESRPPPDRTLNQTRTDRVVEADGYERKRFVGQARRGAPSRETEDRWDLQSAKTSIERAFEGYAVAGDMENGLSDADRTEARKAARGHLALAVRFGEEILERNPDAPRRGAGDEADRMRQVVAMRGKMGGR